MINILCLICFEFFSFHFQHSFWVWFTQISCFIYNPERLPDPSMGTRLGTCPLPLAAASTQSEPRAHLSWWPLFNLTGTPDRRDSGCRGRSGAQIEHASTQCFLWLFQTHFKNYRIYQRSQLPSLPMSPLLEVLVTSMFKELTIALYQSHFICSFLSQFKWTYNFDGEEKSVTS